MVVDVLLLVFGTAATQATGLISWACFSLASACLLKTFYTLWTMTRRAIKLDTRGVVPLNARAINLVCWEIMLSWSLFPVAEGLKQAGLIGFEASEACLCVADYASKVRQHRHVQLEERCLDIAALGGFGPDHGQRQL